jgi:hypothetical protein
MVAPHVSPPVCLPNWQSCSETDCERVAMTGTAVCIGHATLEQILE